MSITPHPNPLQVGMSPGSLQTLTSRPRPPPTSHPVTSKRVCFYKSGDPQFGGLRMIINGRTFKTFDALLDALSKKVPLPFGVRTITTPRGTNSIRALEELHDGGSYVCSDQKRVKPLNLEQANRKQVPWNTTRPISARRGILRPFSRGNLRKTPRRIEFGSRAERIIDRTVAVRTPKRLVVYKNKDPTVKHIVVLQRRTAPNFDALLDYLSQIMQFPVVKMFTPDGRRVAGLAGLILCSGVVVAAGNESFRLSNFNFHGVPPTIQPGLPVERTRVPPQIYHRKTPNSSIRSRKFSLSSERYIMNQIKKSLSESLSEHESHHSGSLETDLNQPSDSVDMEPCSGMAGVAVKNCPAMPTEDDIEKSFRVNQDGSMTVEMKVRLTIKQEEMIHWTTTLSRTSVNCQHTEACTSQPVSGPNSPDVNNDSLKNAGGNSTGRASKGSRHRTSAERTVAFKEQGGNAMVESSRNSKHNTRTPTPGLIRLNSASVESMTTITENEVQENTVGKYSYIERTSEGEFTEGYCVVSQSSTNNTRPVPKPRKIGSAEGKQTTLHSSLRASRVAEVLQIENNDHEVTETVTHIYEPQPQSSYDNYLANTQHVSSRPSHTNSPREHSKPGSIDSGPCSSNNDCDIDLTKTSTGSESLNGKKDEMFSLSSESMAPQQKSRTKLPTGSSENTTRESSFANKIATNKSPVTNKNKTVMSRTQRNAYPLSSESDKRQRTVLTGSSRTIKPINLPGNLQKTRSSTENAQSKKMGKVKKSEKNNGGDVSTSKSSISTLSVEQGLNLDKSAVKDLSHNLNNPESQKPKKPHRKNVQDILMSVAPKGHTKNTILKQKSMSDERVKSPKQNSELSESISLPLICSLPSGQQYVQTWLQQIQPDSVPYMEELNPTETEAEKAVFQVGNDLSERSEKKSALEIPTENKSLGRQQPSIQILREGEPLVDKPQGVRGFCRSMPSVRIHPADQDEQTRMHKSTEVLFSPDSQPSHISDTEENSKGGMRPVLQQLCLSLQSIRRVVIPTHPQSLEKARSLPDFSGQVASVFGASSTKLFSFLSVTALKDDSSSHGSQLSLTGEGSSYPEALKVMQSLEKLSNIEDGEELKASLSDLHNSTSSKFQESWRDFQEKYDIEDNPLLSPKNSEQSFILEVHSEAGDQHKDQTFDIEQLMEELSMSEELRQEISSLAESEMTCRDAAETITRTNEEVTHPKTVSAIIRASDIEDSEVVEIMSIAKIKGDRVDCQRKDHTFKKNKGSPPGEEYNLASDYDTTESPTGSRRSTSHCESYETYILKKIETTDCVATELASELSKECKNFPGGSPVEEFSQKDEDMCSQNEISNEKEMSEAVHGVIAFSESVNTQASASANSPQPEAGDMGDDDSVCSVPNSGQDGAASIQENGSHTNDPHSLSADETCTSEGAPPNHSTEREEGIGLADQENHNCAEVLPSQSEEGDGEVIPRDTGSSCYHSLVSESKLNESVQEESEVCNSMDLDVESVFQTEEAASSCTVELENYTTIPKDKATDCLVSENINSPKSLSVSGSERKPLSLVESTNSQKTNKSKTVGKGNRSEKSSTKSTTSSNSGVRKGLPSTQALHLGVATSRNSLLKINTAGSHSSLPNVRKPLTTTNPGQIKKITTKPKSTNGDRLTAPKQNISESASMPFLCAPSSDVHQYVGSWLEKMQPESVPYTEGMNHEGESEKAMFQIGTSSSEGSEGTSVSGTFHLEKEGLSIEENAGEKQQTTPLIQIKYDGEMVEERTQRMGSCCRSMPSVRIHPTNQECHMRIHKSTECLFPLEGQPQDTESNFKGGFNPVLQQLCSSVQSIRRAVSPTLPVPMEKARSLPDFSVQVASVFGASSTKLLSFLSVMALKDGSSSHGSQLSLTGERSSYPEALKVMQSLEKLSNIEDGEELKASLSDLQNSTSSKFQESWRDFQEKYDIDNNPLLSPKNSERSFLLEVHSEAGGQNKDNLFGIEELMEDLSMSEELRQQISSLFEGEMSLHDTAELPTNTTEEALHFQSSDTKTVNRADDVEDSEVVEIIPVAYTQVKERETSVDEDLEDLNNSQAKTIETVSSIEERSLAGSNEAESLKCEETGSRIAESVDIDTERFLTPVTESEPKETDKESESWRGHDTDHQSEEAKYESSHEEGASYDESHAEEEEHGHAQQLDDLSKEEDIHGDDLSEGECCHEEQADNLAKVNAFVEGHKDLLKGSDSNKDHDSYCRNIIHPNEMMRPDAYHPPCYHSVHPVELSQELLDFVNKALLSSSLTFTYDSNGNLKIHPEIGGAESVREIFRAKINPDNQYGRKRLPSPITSDLSDYRSDTADSEEYNSQMTSDASTDAGDEVAEKVSNSQDQLDRNSDMSYGKNSAKTSNVTPKSDLKSVCSLNSNQDTISRASHQDVASINTSTSFKGDSESVQCLSFYSQNDLREGVLIDKGRWLLKENHLIRTSPPVSMGMYDHMDSSSAESGQDNTSENALSSKYMNDQSPLAAISSSELEEMAKPPTPKCTYFTIPHSSDSDPFQDDQSSNGSRQEDIKRGNRVCPQEEPSKTWARKNSGFSSFASVEFKLPDGKIHPEVGTAVEQQARSQPVGGRTLRAQDSIESLQLICGPNCPIL